MVAGSLIAGASFVCAGKFIILLKIPSAALARYRRGNALLLLAAGTAGGLIIGGLIALVDYVAATMISVGANPALSHVVAFTPRRC